MDQPRPRGAAPGHRRRRAPDRRVHRGPRAGRRDAAARDRRDPRPRPPSFLTARRTSASTPRCSRTPWSTSWRPGVVTGDAQGAQQGQARGRVHDGHEAALRLRRRQPDGRDAGRRLHERHARHPLVPQHDRDQLGDRGGPHGPGRRGLDRLPDVLGRRRADGLHAWRGARARVAGRSSRCRSTAGADGGMSRITPALKEGAGVVTTRAHVRTVVTEFGVAELWGKSLRERAKALIAVAHPDHRDRLTTRRAAPRACGARPVLPASPAGAEPARSDGTTSSGVPPSSRCAGIALRRGRCGAVRPSIVSVGAELRRMTPAWPAASCERSSAAGPAARRRECTAYERRSTGVPAAVPLREITKPPPGRGRRFGWVPGVPSGTHLTRIVGSAAHSR